MPKVSVIIGTYNAVKYIEETIRSVLNQIYQDFELIVVDDGSTDKTVDKVKSLLKPPHQIIQKKNGGEASARNEGLCAAKGEYISFLDHDDLFVPDKLEKQVEFLDLNKDYGMIYGKYAYILMQNEKNNWKNWDFSSTKGISGDIFIKQLINNNIHIITTMVRKECFEKVGLFDETMNYACDSDMWVRLSADYKIGYIDETLAYYRLHDTNVSLDRETCLLHRIASMNKNYELFKERVQANKEIIKSIRNLYYRLIKLYIKQRKFKKAKNYFLDYLRRYAKYKVYELEN
jgi:glycosyltransferase involved in cell wall biosynthesis